MDEGTNDDIRRYLFVSPRVILIFLVITLTLPGQKPVERHRLVMSSADECVRRGASMAERLADDLKPGVRISIACEFSRQ